MTGAKPHVTVEVLLKGTKAMKIKGDYSAASRKAWRTRKKMKQARAGITYNVDLETGLLERTPMPQYMRRWLPCPNYGTRLEEDQNDT